MSTPFTIGVEDPITGLVGSWQEKAEELRLAYSERFCAASNTDSFKRFTWSSGAGVWNWQAGDGTSVDMLQDGANIQSASFWTPMQEFIEFNCFKICDPDKNYEGETECGFYPVNDSWRQFCEWVGSPLYVSDDDYGWPRSIETDASGYPVMLRGRHEAGDYIGGWLVDSLRMCFEHWTANTVSFPNDRLDRDRMTEQEEEQFWDYLNDSNTYVPPVLPPSVVSDTVLAWSSSVFYSWRFGIPDEALVTTRKGNAALASFGVDLGTWDLYVRITGDPSHNATNFSGAINKIKRLEAGLAPSDVSSTYGASCADVGLGMLLNPFPAKQEIIYLGSPRIVGKFDFTNGPA